MASFSHHIEEHELPSVEAVLAGTLALMTGYSQALQAALHPQQRVSMGNKIGSNLALLVEHPQLSAGFREVLAGLRQRWLLMGECTAEAARECGAPERTPARPEFGVRVQMAAPKRLQ